MDVGVPRETLGRGQATQGNPVQQLAKSVPRVLTQRFFARDADVVARDLLGRILVHETPEGRTALRLTETEAYFGPPGMNRRALRRRSAPGWLKAHLRAHGDPAAHSFRGPTARNRPMYGPPGHAYVYLIYGMHECMNVTTGSDGDPQAVLLRAGEPVEGLDIMLRRRATTRVANVAPGPGRLAQALHVTRAWSGRAVTGDAPLHFEAGRAVPDALVEATPRINVVGAEALPLRFVVTPGGGVGAGGGPCPDPPAPTPPPSPMGQAKI